MFVYVSLIMLLRRFVYWNRWICNSKFKKLNPEFGF
nr:MAG TPA: Major transforming protein E5 family [Microviridae sp.]